MILKSIIGKKFNHPLLLYKFYSRGIYFLLLHFCQLWNFKLWQLWYFVRAETEKWLQYHQFHHSKYQFYQRQWRTTNIQNASNMVKSVVNFGGSNVMFLSLTLSWPYPIDIKYSCAEAENCLQLSYQFNHSKFIMGSNQAENKSFVDEAIWYFHFIAYLAVDLIKVGSFFHEYRSEQSDCF